MTLSSDFSAVQILGLPETMSSNRLLNIFDSVGFEMKSADVREKALQGTKLLEVKVKTPQFAMKAIEVFDNTEIEGSLVKLRYVQQENEMGSINGRLQISSVVCSWYKPSKIAWLQYGDATEARAAASYLNGRILLGRKLECHFQHPVPTGSFRSKNIIYSVQVGNLDPETLPHHLLSEERSRRSRMEPKVVMGKLSYEASEAAAARCVEDALRRSGPLENFKLCGSSSTKIKAYATFSSAQDARRAVKDLSGKNAHPSVKSKLFLSHVVSVKFKILREIYEAVQADLDDLKSQLLAIGYIGIKAYAPAGPDQPFNILRVYGNNIRFVAKAKNEVERIFAGTVILKGGSILWNDYFLTTEGMSFLRELLQQYGTFVYRDARKQRLSMYGPSEANHRTGEAVLRKMDDLLKQRHEILLNPKTFQNAVQGGLAQISKILGNGKASLKILPERKTIIVLGDSTAFRTANAILERPPQQERDVIGEPSDKAERVCAVCWTDPSDDEYKTSCGHLYCTTCFISQCTSVGESGAFPICCLGDEGRCARLFGIKELEQVLSSNDFEGLLKASFAAYVRIRPRELQYCHTPDCPQVYRISDDGSVFQCSSCLMPVCTTCQVISHDGLTCNDYRELSKEGSAEFKIWMKQNKVKPCPKCKTPIQKSYGCNHMECSACKTHFCWFCMGTFKASDIYDHMTSKHGNIGIEVARDIEQADADLFPFLD